MFVLARGAGIGRSTFDNAAFPHVAAYPDRIGPLLGRPIMEVRHFIAMGR
jgi:hypothetical protein